MDLKAEIELLRQSDPSDDVLAFLKRLEEQVLPGLTSPSAEPADLESAPLAQPQATFTADEADTDHSQDQPPTTGQITPQELVDKHENLNAVLLGLTEAIAEFEHVVDDTEDQQKLLKRARKRFAIQLSSLLTADDVSDASYRDLSTSLNRFQSNLRQVATQVAGLVERTIRDSSLRKELELAGHVQSMLVPKDGIKVSRLQTYAWYEPADACSGDWWSAVPLGEGDVVLTIGDVTGHGAAAALVAGVIKGACDLARLGMGRGLKPHQLLTMLNRVLSESVNGEFLMTFVGVRFHSEKNVISVANAGHRALWHCRNGKIRVTGNTGDPPLGVRAVHRYSDKHLQLEAGDQIFLFTDGIPECEDPTGRQFGERAMRDVIEAHWQAGPQVIRDEMQQAVREHLGGGRSDDDLTFLGIQVVE